MSWKAGNQIGFSAYPLHHKKTVDKLSHSTYNNTCDQKDMHT